MNAFESLLVKKVVAVTNLELQIVKMDSNPELVNENFVTYLSKLCTSIIIDNEGFTNYCNSLLLISRTSNEGLLLVLENKEYMSHNTKIILNVLYGTELLTIELLSISSDLMVDSEEEAINSLYKLAVHAGQIGIFHYNLDIHPHGMFYANDTYLQLTGLTRNHLNLVEYSDYLELLLETEEIIFDKSFNDYSYFSILSGKIDKTENDIIKIKHKVTGEITYFLSSSEVGKRDEENKVIKFGGIIIDITERIHIQKSLIKDTHYDLLTGLANYKKLIVDMKLMKTGFGLYMDLDKFKIVNDTFGHDMGDEVLKQFSRTIEGISSKVDYINAYRLHGDEFFVTINHPDKNICNKFIEELEDSVKKIKIEEIVVEFSTGVTEFTTGMDKDLFIKNGDYKMYEQKIKKSKK